MYEVFKELYEKINLITKVNFFKIASTRHGPGKMKITAIGKF